MKDGLWYLFKKILKTKSNKKKAGEPKLLPTIFLMIPINDKFTSKSFAECR
jgi:long-subunit fatty acid transport protein